jgi:hypothetical protein
VQPALDILFESIAESYHYAITVTPSDLLAPFFYSRKDQIHAWSVCEEKLSELGFTVIYGITSQYTISWEKQK